MRAIKIRLKNPIRMLYDEYSLDSVLRKDLNLVLFGIATVMIYYPTTTGPALTGYAKALGAGDFFYGLIMAVPVIGAAMQIVASYIIESTGRRKKLFVLFGIIGRGLWILIGAVPLLVPGAMGNGRLVLVMLLITASTASQSFVNVGFFPWMSELAPIAMRGRYMALRSSVGAFVGLVAAIIIAVMLDKCSSFGAYAVLFTIAAFFGMLDIGGFLFVTDTQKHGGNSGTEPFTAILKRAVGNQRFRRFLLFWSLWMFAFNLSNAFGNMYALGMLSLTFLQVILSGQVAYSLTNILITPGWGRLLDRRGPKWVLKRGGILSSAVQLLWLFAKPGSAWPLFLVNIAYGATMPSVDLVNQQMQMSSTPERNRSMYVALFAAVTSVAGTALGYFCGGAILEMLGEISFRVGPVLMDRYKILFVCAGILRIVLLLIFVPGMEDNMDN